MLLELIAPQASLCPTLSPSPSVILHRCDHTRCWPAVGTLTQASDELLTKYKLRRGVDGWAGCCFHTGMHVQHTCFKLNSEDNFKINYNASLRCSGWHKLIEHLFCAASSWWCDAQLYSPWSCVGGACPEKHCSGQDSLHPPCPCPGPAGAAASSVRH